MNMMRDTFNTIHAIYSTQIFEMIMKTTQKVRIETEKKIFIFSFGLHFNNNKLLHFDSLLWQAEEARRKDGEKEEKTTRC